MKKFVTNFLKKFYKPVKFQKILGKFQENFELIL